MINGPPCLDHPQTAQEHSAGCTGRTPLGWKLWETPCCASSLFRSVHASTGTYHVCISSAACWGDLFLVSHYCLQVRRSRRLQEMPYKQTSQPHLFKILGFSRDGSVICPKRTNIVCLIFKRLNVERDTNGSDAELSSKDIHLGRGSQNQQMNSSYVCIKSKRLCVFTFVDPLLNTLPFKHLSQAPHV